MFSLAFMRFLSAHTLSNEIAHFGYVDNYDNPLLRTTVLKITKDEMEMDGDLYLNKMNLSSSVGVYLSGKSNEISSLFSSKPPFAAYFAEDFTGSTIPNYLKKWKRCNNNRNNNPNNCRREWCEYAYNLYYRNINLDNFIRYWVYTNNIYNFKFYKI